MSKSKVPPEKPSGLHVVTSEIRASPSPTDIGTDLSDVSRAFQTPPDYVTGYAEEEWRRVAPLLIKQRIITEMDVTLLATYCLAYQRYRDALNQVREHGISAKKNSHGNIEHSAWYRVLRDSQLAMLKVMQELGMTPRSRSDLPPEPLEDPLEKFLSRKQ